MALDTFSSFIFGHTVTKDNNALNFDEGGPELLASIDIGSFSFTDQLVRVKTALDAAGGQVYAVSTDRTSRLVTISAASNFSLLVSSGSQAGISIFSLLGFTGADRTGTNTYTGDLPSGLFYENQFKLQDFVDSEDFQTQIQASVNESANGVIEVANFGTATFFEMNFRFITNLPQDGKVIRNNPTGLEDARAFLQNVINKQPFEFMKDKDTPNTFSTVRLESTPEDNQGLGFRLRELTNLNLRDYFETGVIRLRVVT